MFCILHFIIYDEVVWLDFFIFAHVENAFYIVKVVRRESMCWRVHNAHKGERETTIVHKSELVVQEEMIFGHRGKGNKLQKLAAPERQRNFFCATRKKFSCKNFEWEIFDIARISY